MVYIKQIPRFKSQATWVMSQLTVLIIHTCVR